MAQHIHKLPFSWLGWADELNIKNRAQLAHNDTNLIEYFQDLQDRKQSLHQQLPIQIFMKRNTCVSKDKHIIIG